MKENPAFSSAIAEIGMAVSRMNMSPEEQENIQVRESEGEISFKWKSTLGTSFQMDISSPSPEKISFLTVKEKAPTQTDSFKFIHEKECLEEVATLIDNGGLTIETHGALLNDDNCQYGHSNKSSWGEKKEYLPSGVQTMTEYRRMSSEQQNIAYNEGRIGDILRNSRTIFNPSMEKYLSERQMLRREKLDTATVLSENKNTKTVYRATIPLNQEHGLREMKWPTGYEAYPQDIIIPPLSKEEIEAMIHKESNPKVAEGLRQYAVDRENYYYNSNEDKHFVYQTASNAKSR